MTLKDIFSLGLQQAPEAAFYQFLNAQTGPQGGPFSSKVANFFAPAAAQGFSLAPFISPFFEGQADPMESLGQFSMANFLGGAGAGGVATQPNFLDLVPTAALIKQALGAAGKLQVDPLATGNAMAQQVVAQALADPASNFDVFQMLAAPMAGQSGGLFGPMIQKYLQQAFDKFQLATPEQSFLQALANNTAGGAFSGLGGF